VAAKLPRVNFEEAPYTTDGVLALAHHPNYIHRVTSGALTESEQKQIGFPWSLEMVERSRRSTGATIAACRAAIEEGVAVNLAGGTHHAHADYGQGFCVFNDAAVAARLMQAERRVSRVAIIDLDVHQGNGTAQIFQDNKNVFTLSMHGKNNYPFHKEISDLDIELPDGINDEDYLALLYKNLPIVIKKHQPDFIFYLCGVDILETDKFGKLKITKNGCLKRDLFVLNLCKENKIPIACAMGGGYSPKIADIVDAHCNTFKAAINLFD
jgi:acetoin utilization deacetylase AcuC-like enzyme